MEIARLKAENYDELLNLLNEVFSIKNNRQVDFEKDLPRMWKRTDEEMGKHLGVFENGQLVAAVGIYPLPAEICGEKILFSTVGNVATKKEYEGKGYMNALMLKAMQELDNIGADASRLGGLRHRYNRFGYETAGTDFVFNFTENDMKFYNSKLEIQFKFVNKNDQAELDYIKQVFNMNELLALRSEEDFYSCLVAWQNRPYIAMLDGKYIGYVSAQENGGAIAEFGVSNEDDFIELLFAWRKKCGNDIIVRLPAYKTNLISKAQEVCSGKNINSPCHFKIINWVKVVNALMKLKSTYIAFKQGEFKLNIKDYGTLKLFCKNGEFGCVKTDEGYDLSLDNLTATRLLFGTDNPAQVLGKDNEKASLFCPLPLSWNLQDRV